MTVYLLKDDLKQLWDYKREGWARRAWNDWMAEHAEAVSPRSSPSPRTLRSASTASSPTADFPFTPA